ncbi:hypothetical protein [Streptomyces sp. NPDC057301]|uniref:hypothetical protein n=1 Tax=Streptomyces sp. NPDC057301 TaxID=3346093 RepID=UPI003628327E
MGVFDAAGREDVGRAGVVVVDDTKNTVKLGVWLISTKTRRITLTTGRLQALAELGLEWARQDQYMG